MAVNRWPVIVIMRVSDFIFGGSFELSVVTLPHLRTARTTSMLPRTVVRQKQRRTQNRKTFSKRGAALHLSFCFYVECVIAAYSP